MLSSRQQSLLRSVIVLGGIIAAASWIYWLCTRSIAVRFLTRHPPAEWILYPNPPDGAAHPIRENTELVTAFRRSFRITEKPATAQMQVRALESFGVAINGTVVPVPARKVENWREAEQLDAAGLLRLGENNIVVTVTNRAGPPVLWLTLDSGKEQVHTDSSWEASCAGAVWQMARVAGSRREFTAGNALSGGETVWGAITQRWPALLGLGLLTGIIVIGTGVCFQRGEPQWKSVIDGHGGLILVMLVGGLWLALGANNLGSLPLSAGFDSKQHLKYIEYILDEHALPLADEGWEMHQPPLFYLLSACGLGVLSLPANTAAGVAFIRIMTMLMGIVHIGLVWASLRILFPQQTLKQALGVVVAGFLPAHLITAQCITNETTMAVFVSATVYLFLRIVKEENQSPWMHAGLGVCLGAGLLAKVTALLVVPWVLAGLAWALVRRKQWSWRVWGSTIGIAVLASGAICGWHYGRVWMQLGSPLGWNEKWAYGSGWWQEEGYRTAGYYLSFWNSLTKPFYSAFHSFADGIYSTLWGDGLCGGIVRMDYRPPWNYELMCVGYLLAVLPSLAVLAGLGMAVWGWIRKPSPEWLVLLGLAFSFALALVYMSLMVPGYGEARASFGLLTLTPFCAFAAMGLDAARKNGLRLAMFAGVVLWAMTSFASVWIDRNGAQAQLLKAVSAMGENNHLQAGEFAAAALRAEPGNAVAKSVLADALARGGQTEKAFQMAREQVQQQSNSAPTHLDLGGYLKSRGQIEEAVLHTRQAIELAPDYYAAHLQLVSLLLEQKKYPEAADKAREALRVKPGSEEIREALKQATEQKTPKSK